MSTDYSLADYQRPVLTPPEGVDRVLVHSCCAPCAGEVLEAMQASNLTPEVFFYNPNIHPLAEYTLRKDEAKRQCDELDIPWLDGDYDTERWFSRIQGKENEPERGARCTLCFDMRFERTAQVGQQRGYSVFTSTLGISRWKDMQQINLCGERAAKSVGLNYWDYNWRKKGGSGRMVEIAKRDNYYQQEYCGCVYSLRDTNRTRQNAGRARIQRGVKFYEPIATSTQ